MPDEPVLPKVDSIGDIIIQKNMEEFKYSIIRCIGCNAKKNRDFIIGDYVYKEFQGEPCIKCSNKTYQIIEIYAEFKKIKKNKKKDKKENKKIKI